MLYLQRKAMDDVVTSLHKKELITLQVISS